MHERTNREPHRPTLAPRRDLGKATLDFLFRPTDAASLGAFRILFGALMAWEVLEAFRHGHVRELTTARVLFPYELLPFVAPWPGNGMYAHYVLMGAGAAGMLLGLLYRWSAALFLITYGYAFLLDKASYNNHYYLIILLSALLLCSGADRWASLDQWRRPRPEVVPFWNYFVLRAQMFLVFFYAGVAKLNADWLAGEPMRTWLADEARRPVLGPLLGSEAAVWIFAYGGLLFDLSVGFLLLSRRTLPLALAGLLIFNLTNHWLFSIGVFPFLVLATAILFERPDFPRSILRRPLPAPLDDAPPSPARRQTVIALLALYLAAQSLLPLRHWLYRGDVNWTEEGHRFAWHMKLRSKQGWVRFEVTDPRTAEIREIDPRTDLTRRQRRKLAACPDMILQYAHRLADEQRRRGVEHPDVRAHTRVSLNRRPPQPIVDPGVNLAEARASVWSSSTWIAPLDPNGRPGAISFAEFAGLRFTRPKRSTER